MMKMKNDNMFRREFVEELSKRTGLSGADANEVTMAFLDILEDTWCQGRGVNFTGFGAFELRPISERMARNPKTMEDALVPAGFKPVFKVSRGLRATINDTIRQNQSGK